jgi:hypothetical protein
MGFAFLPTLSAFSEQNKRYLMTAESMLDPLLSFAVRPSVEAHHPAAGFSAFLSTLSGWRRRG